MRGAIEIYYCILQGFIKLLLLLLKMMMLMFCITNNGVLFFLKKILALKESVNILH